MTTRYTKDHEYVRVEGDTGVVGITDYAQGQLGDVVYVELPTVGKTVAKGGEAAVVESVKAASEVYAPVSGEVVEVNGDLEGSPGTALHLVVRGKPIPAQVTPLPFAPHRYKRADTRGRGP